MNRYLKAYLIFVVISALLSSEAIQAAPMTRSATKASSALQSPTPITTTRQSIGTFALTVQDNGIFGLAWEAHAFEYPVDCFLGDQVTLGLEFPKRSGLDYLSAAALWIGAVKGNDTLVSTGYTGWGYSGDSNIEFQSTDNSGCGFDRITSIQNSLEYSPEAISEQDIVSTYTDTAKGTSRDYFFVRPHIPLDVEVIQKVFAWSFSYASDFVIFNVHIENIGDETLKQFTYAIFYDGDVYQPGTGNTTDDMGGFLSDAPSVQGCGGRDTLDVAWIADNDGDPHKGEFLDHVVWEGGAPYQSVRNIAGICFLNKPGVNQYRSFNWWIGNYDRRYDFGPRHIQDFRDFRTGGLGFPFGDVNRYSVMTNYETDYDQAYMASIPVTDPNWLFPDPTLTSLYGKGGDTYFLLSQGLYELQPGASIDFAFAVVAGENFHTDVNNLDNLPDNPEAYYANLDFSDLVKNATWANWIYDNPGIDTDGDGYFGKSRVCVYDSALTDSGWVVTVADTSWYEGDGVPDWRAAGPPPAPDFWMEPAVNGMTIRFNGSRSETEKDYMTGIVDFEGYHVWLGRDDRESSYSVIAGYDLENFDKFVWNDRAQPSPNFELFESPFTLKQLRCLYGSGPNPCNDSTFDPYRFTRSNPYIHPLYPDSIFRFERHNFNMSQLDAPNGIHKVYPNEPPPPRGANPDSLNSERYTNDGYLKYYEYEFTIENLLPTVSYWVNVTAFDFGSPESGVFPLETSRTVGAKSAFPFMADNRLNGKSMKAYVYPNPYRIDGNYRANGYEGRTREIMPNEKVRSIHFANLPPKCTISIFSIDGDLVREIHHDVDPSDPNYLHDEWNLVTRNRQAVVSGLYYWTIEDDNGNVQIGKLAIVM